jgi:hypothetical protein
MLFSDRLYELNNDPGFQEFRCKLVDSLLAGFSASFPTVAFRPELTFRIINAQAVTTGTGREVRLYGGLAFHPRLSFHSLTLVLLHEVGHHLSTGCRSAFDVGLACECEADHWSVTSGLDALKIPSPQPFDLSEAIEELGDVLSQKADVENETEKGSSGCWSAHWPARKDALLKKTPCSGVCSR